MDTVWTGRPESGRLAYFLWNLGIRFYQYHLEGEIKPFQWVGPQNVQVRPGRLEPISKVKASWAMIRAQMSTPSRNDLWSERIVSVQRRAEIPPKLGRLA